MDHLEADIAEKAIALDALLVGWFGALFTLWFCL
jgi:hypothetical protein